MDHLYSLSVPILQDIQDRFADNEEFLSAINQLSDPAYAFNIIVPILATFNTLLAIDILVVSVLAEWSNCILKWFIKEDRPYWWIRETSVKKIGYPYMRQGPLTCETGPGSPSGHLMGFAAIFYVLISYCIKHYSQRSQRAGNNNLALSVAFWTVYVGALVMVSISRMYAITHFPHQCLLGAFLGFLIGYYFGNKNQKLTEYWQNSSKLRMFSFVLIMTLISFATYWLQKALGIDPQWSVKMAFKWCERVEYVHVSTTPLFSLVRDTGLSLGMVAVSPVGQRGANKHNLLVSVACVVFYCTALHMAQAAIPTHNANIFYLCHAVLHSTMAYILFDIIPKVAVVKTKIQ